MQCVPILCLHFSETTGPLLLKPNTNIEKGEEKKKKQANKQNNKWRIEVRCANKVQYFQNLGAPLSLVCCTRCLQSCDFTCKHLCW